MSIYNEVYGLYYFMLDRILEKASQRQITITDINDIVSRHGFSESSIYFTPDVISEDGYNLLRKSKGGYISALKSEPKGFMTNMQRGFVKSMLYDKRIGLFFDNEALNRLRGIFKDAEPLFNVDDVVPTETAADSDDYTDESYINRFKILLNAIKEKNALRIVFDSSKGERKTVTIMPYKLEYGVRDDKFRLCGVSIYNEKIKSYIKINLARMLAITPLKQSLDIDFETFIARKRRAEPIEIEVSNMRNGFERVFIGLSNYERISSFDEETGKSTIKIYYGDDDEQELLILLLSFGPAIKVLSPPEFRNMFADRIKRQFSMIRKPQE